jgi:hypothetical protein
MGHERPRPPRGRRAAAPLHAPVAASAPDATDAAGSTHAAVAVLPAADADADNGNPDAQT